MDLPRPPSVDAVLRSTGGAEGVARYGHAAMADAVRAAIAAARQAGSAMTAGSLAEGAKASLDAASRPSLRRVLNLTGTVLHTNLGRAPMADAAVAAVAEAMQGAVTLEYDLAKGGRGERDDHLRGLLRELTGAEDGLVVNNNAAAVLLALAALAGGRATLVSRGELIEIGGSFRMPAIMESAGTRLVEVGTTNRTHPRDYAEAIGPDTVLLLKVHTSNYRIEGFTAEVTGRDLARIAHDAGLPMMHDLGSGTLVDLRRHGLPAEQTVADAIRDGADLVTFSGDKLLGGPQAGFVVGRADLVARCAKHPLRRALRLDRMRIAALEATLKLYRDEARLTRDLPTLRLLTRREAEIRAVAEQCLGAVAAWAGPEWQVEVVECRSQIGSGAVPVETLPSAGLALRPARAMRGGALDDMTARLRALDPPVIGRVQDRAVRLDLRCLEKAEELIGALRRR